MNSETRKTLNKFCIRHSKHLALAVVVGRYSGVMNDLTLFADAHDGADSRRMDMANLPVTELDGIIEYLTVFGFGRPENLASQSSETIAYVVDKVLPADVDSVEVAKRVTVMGCNGSPRPPKEIDLPQAVMPDIEQLRERLATAVEAMPVLRTDAEENTRDRVFDFLNRAYDLGEQVVRQYDKFKSFSHLAGIEVVEATSELMADPGVARFVKGLRRSKKRG